MAKATHGSGSIERLPSGRYRYQFYVEGRRVRGSVYLRCKRQMVGSLGALGIIR